MTAPRALALLLALVLAGGLLAGCCNDICCSTRIPPDPCEPCPPQQAAPTGSAWTTPPPTTGT